MEEKQRFQDSLLIECCEQRQSGSAPGNVCDTRISLCQEPFSPWFGDEGSNSSVSDEFPINGDQFMLDMPAAPEQNSTRTDGPLTPIPNFSIASTASTDAFENGKYPRISVVIPTRNEAANLPYVLPRIPATIDEVILVDGHSTDGTVEVARQLLPDIRIVEQSGKGKGDAIRVGCAACTGDIIVLLDADGSANPGEIAHFVEALMAGNDFAKGSRFMEGGDSHDITRLRRWGNYWLSQLVNVLFRTRFTDLCYGYNAFWRRCLNYVSIESDGFEVETEINLRMQKARLKIVEVPSIEYLRIHGESKLHAVKDGWRVLKTILREKCFSSASPYHSDTQYTGALSRLEEIQVKMLNDETIEV